MDPILTNFLAECLRFLVESLRLVICSLAVAAISMTLTKAKVFAKLRRTVKSRSAFLGELFDCPYCMSHWVAFFTVAVFRPRPVLSGWIIADLALSAFVMVALAPFFAGKIFHTYNGMAEGSYKPLGAPDTSEPATAQKAVVSTKSGDFPEKQK